MSSSPTTINVEQLLSRLSLAINSVKAAESTVSHDASGDAAAAVAAAPTEDAAWASVTEGAEGSESLVPAYEGDDWEIDDDEAGNELRNERIFEEFCADEETLERLRVTPSELQALQEVRLCGELTSRNDLLFILRKIRDGAAVAKMAFGPRMEEQDAGRDFAAMTARLRHEAQSRLAQDAGSPRVASTLYRVAARLLLLLGVRTDSHAELQTKTLSC